MLVFLSMGAPKHQLWPHAQPLEPPKIHRGRCGPVLSVRCAQHGSTFEYIVACKGPQLSFRSLPGLFCVLGASSCALRASSRRPQGAQSADRNERLPQKPDMPKCAPCRGATLVFKIRVRSKTPTSIPKSAPRAPGVLKRIVGVQKPGAQKDALARDRPACRGGSRRHPGPTLVLECTCVSRSSVPIALGGRVISVSPSEKKKTYQIRI